MIKTILVFSGMPASGKDTISKRLTELNSKYECFKKHRTIGPNDIAKNSYINISMDEFKKMIDNNSFLQYHVRYGRYYGIEEKSLMKMLNSDIIPIIHIGRIENYYIFVESLKKVKMQINIIHIQLWETKEELKKRICHRDILFEEIERRINAMEQEFYDAKKSMQQEEKPFSLVIKNKNIEETCNVILKYVNGEVDDNGYDEFWNYLRTI